MSNRTHKMNWKARGIERKDDKVTVARTQASGPRAPTITRNVEIIGILEEIVSILNGWPEAAAMFAGLVRSAQSSLAYTRTGGALEYAREKMFERSLKMLRISLKKGELPDQTTQRSRRPQAKYVRAPLATFLTDPTSLPKAPPGRK